MNIKQQHKITLFKIIFHLQTIAMKKLSFLVLCWLMELEGHAQDAYLPNLNPPFRLIGETEGGTNPYFATGSGGILQSVLMGFGRLEITSKGIIQRKPVLPPH